jgi:hypothetical protein
LLAYSIQFPTKIAAQTMDRNLLVFSALRKGAFLEHFAALQDEQLRPFLPYLVHFCFKSEGSSTPELVGKHLH